MAKKDLLAAINAYNEKNPGRNLSAGQAQIFGAAAKSFIKALNEAAKAGESEEHSKKIINAFLEENFYPISQYQINTTNNIDSTIKSDGKLLAIIEVKRLGNQTEMAAPDNINKKALWELVLYYLNETRDSTGKKVSRKKDAEIQQLIMTDGLRWVFIASKDFEPLCDEFLAKHFYKYRRGQLVYSNNNAKFYEDIRKYFDEIDITKRLPFIYFDIEKMVASRKNWGVLYKAFSPEFLLNRIPAQRPMVRNSLNTNFYHELLYILGLKETVEDKKIVIKINKTIKNSLAEQIYSRFIIEKALEETDATERTFELVITWLNRLLFIKLFEGQLIAFNGNDACYRILDKDKIKDFDQLQLLFFDVLGRKKRPDDDFYSLFSKVPYLNSSLFERQEIELQDYNISILRNLSVEVKPNTSLGKKYPKQVPILTYIIDFLDSYDFDADAPGEDTGGAAKEIIDAAVLGLIFEKLNGYKDGSHYTPSFITQYMCDNTLRRVVLRKINAAMSWNCKELWEVKERASGSLEIAQKVNLAINSIRICDPAVGSGHFLVSALNRLIALKWELGVLFKYGTEHPERLRECKIEIIDDVLCITDGQGHPFRYDKRDYLSQQIQETLFNEKRVLIEDCLFGVDLNAKAVSICNLRLWIELLKNAYYKNDVMETLPNIDINIKHGNSLRYRVGFAVGKKIGAKDISLDNHTKQLIREYKKQVKQYKSESDKNAKKAILQTIKNLRANLHQTWVQLSIFETTTKQPFSMYDGAFEWAFEFPEIIGEDGTFLGFDCVIGNPPYIQIQKMGAEADRLRDMDYSTYTRMGDVYCLFYEIGRKLLSERGVLSFITSNKWMRAGYGEKLRAFLAHKTNPLILLDFAGQKIFDEATVDVNILSFEKGDNAGKTQACTVKDDCRDNLSVYVEQNCNSLCFSGSESWCILSPIEERIREKMLAVGTPLKDWNISINYGIKTGLNEAFIIDSATRDALIATDPKSAEIIRPILRGRDISRYGYDFANLWIILTGNGDSEHDAVEIENYPAIKAHLDQFLPKLKKRQDKGITPYHLRSCAYMDDFSKQKIVWGNLSLSAQYSLAEENVIINAPATMIVPGDKYLLGILNSTISDFYIRGLGVTRNGGYFEYKPMFVEKLPIPQVDSTKKQEIIELVDAIIARQLDGVSTSSLDIALDNRVFEIFGLSEEEIKYLQASKMTE